ncbi:Y-family DNA polymerase [Chryseobacterium muglaense]|uniref:Y-family DNA polymerase n=1 Tax=Chryseobacterium muglaense TaxID=2893752 RepID=UPI00293EADC3|nr:hypothetical protein [Chryseobacterium muglaense]
MFGLIDGNNFYASCERLFRPDLRDKPVIVLSNNDGCAIARSQEAKDLGIKMGAPAFLIEDIIKKHNVAVFSANFILYGDISNRIVNISRRYCQDIEVYSVDYQNLKIITSPKHKTLIIKHLNHQLYI